MSEIVSSLPGRSLLPAIRKVLRQAEEVLLAVAFIDTNGIHLLTNEMKTVGSLRILATSRFNRPRTDTAFARAVKLGARARLLNPKGPTFHPKMYLARRGRAFTGVIGSANLTSGIVGNYETAVVVTGTAPRDGWTLAEALWNHADGVEWTAQAPVRPDELDPALYRYLARFVHRGMAIHTLGDGQRNEILAFSETGATVATARSAGADVPARMIQIGYDALVTSPDRRITYPYLTDTLRVHRSSFVLALLAQLPMVRQVGRRPITIEISGPTPVQASCQGA